MPCCGARDSGAEFRALSQPQRHGSHGRSPWSYIRVIVLMLNAIFIGAVFLLDPTLQSQIRQGNWYIRSYGVLALLTLVQYLYTANSSPGYLADMLRAGSGMHATFISTAILSKQAKRKWNLKFCHDSRQIRSTKSTIRCTFIAFAIVGSISSWFIQQGFDLLFMWSHSDDELWRITGVMLILVGIAMHAPAVPGLLLVLWYIFEQAILAGWTIALYIQFLHLDMNESWLKGLTGLILLAPLIIIHIVLVILVMMHTYLALTNQTTYEIARSKRITYLRGVPTKVHPFSKGICMNLYDLCLSRQKGYDLEAVPPLEELEARARPYTCRDAICCRCC